MLITQKGVHERQEASALLLGLTPPGRCLGLGVGTRAVDTRVAVVVAGVKERSQVRTNFTDIPDD